MASINVLDCTLRDGGYYTNWDFSDDLVLCYLNSMESVGVKFVELGFRNYAAEGFRGAYYYSPEKLIARVAKNVDLKLGVMIDAKTVLGSEVPISESISDLFVPAVNSSVDFVRVATHFSEIDGAKHICAELKELGYVVFINLMQISQQTEADIIAAAREIDSWGSITGLYFADSLGNLKASQVEMIINFLRKGWSGDLGIHAHNNLGLALANSLAAVENGVSYVDATVTGMGRGAGNVEIESLLPELNDRGTLFGDINVLARLILSYFQPMKNELGWGPGLLYSIAARNNIHPTYVQRILTDPHYTAEERIVAVSRLTKLKGQLSFGSEKLAILFDEVKDKSKSPLPVPAADIRALKFDTDKPALLIGSGKSTRAYSAAISDFLSENNCIVFGLNRVAEDSLQELTDYNVMVRGIKRVLLTELEKYKTKIITSTDRLSEEELKEIEIENMIDFRTNLVERKFVAEFSHSIIPFDLSAAYALAFIISRGFKKILFAGFDGYASDDIRQREMIDLVYMVRNAYPEIELIAITPSTYPFEQGSLFAPSI
jgi:4-hydroxy 2-oxovalerate aldolase